MEDTDIVFESEVVVCTTPATEDAQESENKEETEEETILTAKPKEVKESKIVASSSGFQKAKIKSTKGKKPTVSSTEEDILRIRKRKLLLECSKLRLEIQILKKDLESKEKKKSFDK